MESKGALKWLQRLEEPRTIESLISEVFGEAVFYGCLFENEVADFLNFHELGHSFKEFDTESFTLSVLIKEVDKRCVLEGDEMLTLTDAKNARNELIHRLVTKKPLFSQIDREMFLAEIDALYFRILKGYELACALKKHSASQFGITEEFLLAEAERRKSEATMDDDDVKRLLG